MVDVEADDVPLPVEASDKAVDDLTGLRARRAFQLDLEAVGLRVLMQFHGSCSRKFRSGREKFSPHAEPLMNSCAGWRRCE
jgi:hypothetical protein